MYNDLDKDDNTTDEVRHWPEGLATEEQQVEEWMQAAARTRRSRNKDHLCHEMLTLNKSRKMRTAHPGGSSENKGKWKPGQCQNGEDETTTSGRGGDCQRWKTVGSRATVVPQAGFRNLGILFGRTDKGSIG